MFHRRWDWRPEGWWGFIEEKASEPEGDEDYTEIWDSNIANNTEDMEVNKTQ